MGLLACQLRSPRTPLRRLARQPGTVALACSTLILAAEVATMLSGWSLKRLHRWASPIPPGTPIGYSNRVVTLTDHLDEVGPAIAACWLLLVALGRWKPEPTWLDRLGRAFGASWIAVHILCGLISYSQL